MEFISGTQRSPSVFQLTLLIFAILQNAYGQSCGGSLTGTGRFTSPNYPANYPVSVTCQWNLTADAATGTGNAVSLFIEELRTENHYDSLDIYSEGILMTRYTGVISPHTSVYGRSITVVLRSDEVLGAKGFSIFFNSTGPSCGTSCSKSGCSFWTPNFPGPYPSGSHCAWSISNGQALLAFEPTALSATPFTGVLTMTSPMYGVPSTATFTSPTPMPPATILDQFVAINFTSSRCRNGQGFLLSVQKKNLRCGGPIVGQGSFGTTNYPLPYSNNTVCVWQLTALTGRRVQLTVIALYMETLYDYVRVYSDNQLVGSYTGTLDPFILTLGGTVYVEFQSDSTIAWKGFAASFISV